MPRIFASSPRQTARDCAGDQSDGCPDRAGDGPDGGPGGGTAGCSDSGAHGMRSGRSGDGITIGVGSLLFVCLFRCFCGHVVVSFLVLVFRELSEINARFWTVIVLECEPALAAGRGNSFLEHFQHDEDDEGSEKTSTSEEINQGITGCGKHGLYY